MEKDTKKQIKEKKEEIKKCQNRIKELEKEVEMLIPKTGKVRGDPVVNVTW